MKLKIKSLYVLILLYFSILNPLLADCNALVGANFVEKAFCTALRTNFCTFILLENGNDEQEYYFRLCNSILKNDCDTYFTEEDEKHNLCQAFVNQDCTYVDLYTSTEEESPNFFLTVNEDFKICSGIIEDSCADRLVKNKTWKGLCDEVGDVFRKPTLEESQEISQSVTPDKDGDLITDFVDNCPDTKNVDQFDLDLDGLGDICDDDIDGDTKKNNEDNCPRLANTDQADADRNGKGDKCQDSDSDGFLDSEDKCPLIYNPDQRDKDADRKGDVCDDEADGDTVANGSDNCVYVSNTNQADADHDGRGDVCDIENPEIDYFTSTPFSKTLTFNIKDEFKLIPIFKCGDYEEKCPHPEKWTYLWKFTKAPVEWAKQGEKIPAADKGKQVTVDANKQEVATDRDLSYKFEFLGKYEIEACVQYDANLTDATIDWNKCKKLNITIIKLGDHNPMCWSSMTSNGSNILNLLFLISTLCLLYFKRKV